MGLACWLHFMIPRKLRRGGFCKPGACQAPSADLPPCRLPAWLIAWPPTWRAALFTGKAAGCAGSEQAALAAASSTTFKEGAGINLGLLSLGGVIEDLARGNPPQYNDCSLTRILKPGLRSLPGSGAAAAAAAAATDADAGADVE